MFRTRYPTPGTAPATLTPIAPECDPQKPILRVVEYDNQTLSEQRAAAVKQWLVASAQVNGANISTRGWGKSKPVAYNAKPDGSDDPDGRAKNRRVQIIVRKGA